MGAGLSVLGLAPWEVLFGIDGPVLLTLIPNALGLALLFGWFFGCPALSQRDASVPTKERIPEAGETYGVRRRAA